MRPVASQGNSSLSVGQEPSGWFGPAQKPTGQPPRVGGAVGLRLLPPPSREHENRHKEDEDDHDHDHDRGDNHEEDQEYHEEQEEHEEEEEEEEDDDDDFDDREDDAAEPAGKRAATDARDDDVRSPAAKNRRTKPETLLKLWIGLGHPADALQFSADSAQYYCGICKDVWRTALHSGQLRQHCMRLRHVRLARAMNVPGVGSTDAGRSVLQERNAAMMKTWMSLGHSEDALQFSEDGTQYFCCICNDQWRSLAQMWQLRRHCMQQRHLKLANALDVLGAATGEDAGGGADRKKKRAAAPSKRARDGDNDDDGDGDDGGEDNDERLADLGVVQQALVADAPPPPPPPPPPEKRARRRSRSAKAPRRANPMALAKAWTDLGNAADALQLSDDGTKFYCCICKDKWRTASAVARLQKHCMRQHHLELARALDVVPGNGVTDAGRTALQRRNASLVGIWTGLGYSVDALQFSSDGTKYYCRICDDSHWRAAAETGQLRRHCLTQRHREAARTRKAAAGADAGAQGGGGGGGDGEGGAAAQPLPKQDDDDKDDKDDKALVDCLLAFSDVGRQASKE